MIANLFNTKVDIIRFTKASDGMGGGVEAEGVLHSNLPCRINWVRGSEKIFTSKDTWFRDAKLYCGIIDITTKDRVLYSGDYYEIVNVSNVDNANKYLIVEIKLVA